MKYETQHTIDIQQYDGITPMELEYRAKLVELHYCNNLSLLQKFLAEADTTRENDSRALASIKIKNAYQNTDLNNLCDIQAKALARLLEDNQKMKKKYGLQKAHISI